MSALGHTMASMTRGDKADLAEGSTRRNNTSRASSFGVNSAGSAANKDRGNNINHVSKRRRSASLYFSLIDGLDLTYYLSVDSSWPLPYRLVSPLRLPTLLLVAPRGEEVTMYLLTRNAMSMLSIASWSSQLETILFTLPTRTSTSIGLIYLQS